MSKTYSLTKDEIIQAIRKEPLGATSPGWIKGNPNAKCRVCAVGGVMRHLTALRKTAPKFIYEDDIIDTCDMNTNGTDGIDHLNEYNPATGRNYTAEEVLSVYGPLAALSSVYEKEARKHQAVAKTKKALVKFVRSASFPKRVKITINTSTVNA